MLFEIEITDKAGSNRRTIRVRAESEEAAWDLVSIDDNELASIRIIEESSSPSGRPTTPSSLEAAKPSDPGAPREGTPSPRPLRKRPILADLNELFLRAFTGKAISESELADPQLKPSLVLPVSLLARRGLVVFYAVSFAGSLIINSRQVDLVEPLFVRRDSPYYRGPRVDIEWDFVTGAIWAAVNLLIWIAIVAVIRYAFFVYPWERRRRTSSKGTP